MGEAANTHVPQLTQMTGGWRCHRGLTLPQGTGAATGGRRCHRGPALPQGAGAATGGSFSSAAALTHSQHLSGGAAAASGRGGGASASAVVAGLVDALPSADAEGRADTVSVVDRYGRPRRLYRQPFQGWCMVRLRQIRRFRWTCSPIWSIFEGAAVGREEDASA